MAYTPYAEPNVTNAVQVFQYANTVTSDLFGAVVLFLIWIVAFISMRTNYGTKDSFVVSSFICSVLSVLFRMGELVGDHYVVLFWVMTAIGVIVLTKESY